MFLPVQKQFGSDVILGLRLAFGFWSKGNSTELSCTKKSSMLAYFFCTLSNSVSFCPLSAAKLGDTRELESFIDMLDRELAGAYLKELHPLSLNPSFIPFALKLTRQRTAACDGGVAGPCGGRVLLHIEKQSVY